MKPTLDFWLDFASTYSYLSGLRIDCEAARFGVHVRWRPFLLGPVFAAQGWSTSPFNVYPAKGRYMVRDIARIAASRGLPFQLPDPFPQHSLLAARAAMVTQPESKRAAFGRAVLEAEFAQGQSIADPAVIEACLLRADVEPAATLAASQTDPIKAQLRAETEQAMALGIFGAPTFVTIDGELFWGDDRLDSAIAWALAAQSRSPIST